MTAPRILWKWISQLYEISKISYPSAIINPWLELIRDRKNAYGWLLLYWILLGNGWTRRNKNRFCPPPPPPAHFGCVRKRVLYSLNCANATQALLGRKICMYICTLGYNKFDFKKKIKNTDPLICAKFKSKTYLLYTFLIFGTVFCAFSFKV